ncbi:MAG: DNA-binding response regulator, partial [Alphaproteobacteria bacterium]
MAFDDDGVIRVYLIDDHALVRTGLRLALDQPDIEVVGEAGSGEVALPQLR